MFYFKCYDSIKYDHYSVTLQFTTPDISFIYTIYTHTMIKLSSIFRLTYHHSLNSKISKVALSGLSHVRDGLPVMVDISNKPLSMRTATAYVSETYLYDI